MEIKTVNREDILNNIVDALKPLDYVNAVWQCGSAAFKRVDEWSDIDFVVDVADDKIMDIFPILDESLGNLSKIEDTFEAAQGMSEGAYQKVYKLEGTSKFLVIEVCAVKHSSTDKFLTKEIHGDTIVHFDKCDVTKPIPIDKAEFASTLRARIERAEKVFRMNQFLIEKELNRKNFIEAFAFYQGYSLSILLEMLRIRHNPYRYSFRTRYVYYDFPEAVVNKLHNFYFIKDGDELRQRHQEVIQWFMETIEELKTINIEDLL